MTILTVNKKDLEKKIGRITPDVEEKITMMGTPIEGVTDNELSVEVFPNRPDLLSLQNFARAVKQYLGNAGMAKFRIHPPEKDYTVTIDKSVKEVRPHTVCAIAKGLKFDDEKIKEIIDLQEKLHGSIGRKRKKIAIGIYPLERISLPIKFLAKKPEDILFKPLESKKELTGRQILRQHPAGREYANLLKDNKVFPLFIDAEEKILSMPPIINSEEVGRITRETREIFIECSGHNLPYLKKCMNIIVSVLSELGGKIYAMKIDDRDGEFISPNMEPEKLSFKIKDINKTLGIELSEKEIKKLFGLMGLGYENKNKPTALIPPYRADILHWIDLAEEIAIAYGYENFKPEIPQISTIAEEDPFSRNKKIVAEILAGLGFLEVSSYHLVIKKDVKKMHFDYGDFVEVEDSKTERDVLRMDLISSLLQTFSENSDARYPQKIFEMGKVFSHDESDKSETGVKETERLAISMIEEKMNFTELKQVLDYLFKMLDKKYVIENVENNNYISGRVGKILSEGKEIGYIGEIAPRVLKNYKIKMPVVALEIDLDFLS
jgi:phenylalanyl-tRNA synthetase beta chain